jgi:superoxide dismutase, Cu-Zn family
MYSNYDNNIIKAVCVVQGFRSSSNNGQNIAVKGIIYLEQKDSLTTISGKITGLIPNQLHAIHIHEFGDLTDGCTSACAHYNPFNMPHGFPSSPVRHVGDLGNIKADINGVSEFSITDNLVKLDGQYSVIGRSIVIHKDEDDGGLGGHKDSLTTGHAGARISCGVIGYRKNC